MVRWPLLNVVQVALSAMIGENVIRHRPESVKEILHLRS